jgi:hypothetical protein
MASHTQRYISNDLSHFVGRDLLEDPQAQYERLKAILHEGKLRRPRRSDEQEGTIYAVHVDAEGSISRNEMYFGTAVCFCDIRRRTCEFTSASTVVLVSRFPRLF